MGSYAFRNTDIYSSALTGAVYADNWIVDFNKTITDTLVIDKLTVGIARYSFYNCTTLKSDKIDGDVKYVCRGAFYNCTSLEKVTFPDTLEKIGDYAFYNCVSLKLTSLPPQLREIGRAAFYQCGKADNYVNDTENDILEIPQGVTYIGDYAFYGFGFRTEEAIDGVTRTAGIDIVTIGDGVEYIGKNAFRGFSSLKEVIILGAAVIGDGAFYECPSLETVTVSGKLTKVGTKAFYKCESLASASFPDTLVSIGDGAFYGCSALSELTLGAGLERIGKLAFYKNTALCGVTLPATLTKIDEQAFRGCTSLASLTVGASVEFVGAHAFYACDALTLYFAEGVRTDEWSAVWNSAFAPVISGCTIKDGYLVSLTVGGIANKFTDTKLSAPCREGFDFLGFNSVSEASVAEYALDEILGVDSGTVLYAVWTAKKPDSGSQES